MADNGPTRPESSDEEEKESNAPVSKSPSVSEHSANIEPVDHASHNQPEDSATVSLANCDTSTGCLYLNCDADNLADCVTSLSASNSNGLAVSAIHTNMGCSQSKKSSVVHQDAGSESQKSPMLRHENPQPNIPQQNPENGACASQSVSGGPVCLNGLVSVCSFNSGMRTSPINSLSALPAGSSSNSQSVCVNGNGIVTHDLSTDDNFDQLSPNSGVSPGSLDQCQKGAKPKKLKRRPRRDDRHSKTSAYSLTQSDSDEEDLGFQNSASKAVGNAKGYSQWGGFARTNGQCNGEVSHPCLPVCRTYLDCERPARNRYEAGGAAAVPVSPPRDEDMVDEGAVCDFDRNLVMEENLYYTEDTSVSSPSDGANVRCSFANGHLSYSTDQPQLQCHGRERPRRCSPHGLDSGSDSEDDLFGPRHAEAGGQVRVNNVDDMEDNGDFIDADLPAMPGPLMSSSADSASLSSVNGECVDAGPGPALDVRDQASPRQENDLSGGSDKELNHKQQSPPDARRHSDSTMFRTSYSSHDGGFDNFLLRDLSSSDGVFWNSSESENEDELNEPSVQEHQNKGPDMPSSSLEGAGVAEAMVTIGHSDQQVGEPQFGAGGDFVCFHFDRACCVQDHHWSSNGLPHAVLAGQSASRHCPHLSEGEAGGACAPSPPVNNLSRLLPATSALRGPGEAMANGLDDVAPSNFNDESNHQQKVFDKFPMVEEGREGACSSGAGQGKCDNDKVLFLCPVAPAPGIVMERQGDRGGLQDRGVLEPNVETFSSMGVSDYNYKCPFTDSHHWRVNSESGVSEAVLCEERNYGYGLCPSSECCGSHNAHHHTVPLSKGCKEHKKKRLVCRPIENGVDCVPSVERIMIWSEYEAYLLQVKQIGMSACGQTAVLNLLKAFEMVMEKEEVCSTIPVNLRKDKASVAEYLASRAVAGTTAEELLSGVERLTKGEIRGRFFHLWPPRDVQLLSWISQWMRKGAVPIATLNLQRSVKQQQIPDAWHHQMVYGVGPRGVYLTNPLEIVTEETMLDQLSSDSVLLVRRQDVVSRFQPTASLAPLLHHPDPRWCTFNVLGQVVNVLREHNMPSVPGYRAQVTSHIRIPAVYRAGITLYVRHNTAQWTALCTAPDLPLASSDTDTA